jgi:hypothetical protein
MISELGRADEARRRWEALASSAESPIDRIQAFDDLAASYLDAADLDGAGAVIERSRKALAEVVAEETPLGERARSALSRMRSAHRLEREIAAREKGVTIDKPSKK